MPEIVLIAAVAKNGVIGKDNQLLWSIPEDMRHFRALTLEKTVVMGRNTWESLPDKFRPLPKRRNIVVSRRANFSAPGAEVCTSLDAVLAACSHETTAFIIGGGELYAQAMPLAHTLILTELDIEPEGDAHFPNVAPEHWEAISREPLSSETGVSGAFVTYRRRDPLQPFSKTS